MDDEEMQRDLPKAFLKKKGYAGGKNIEKADKPNIRQKLQAEITP